MTYLTEAERLERKRLTSKRYRSKEEVKLKKNFCAYNRKRKKEGESILTFEEYKEWRKKKHAPKGSLYAKYKSFIKSRKKREKELLSFEEYCKLLATRNSEKSLSDEEKRLLRNQKAKDYYHNNEESRKKKLARCKEYKKETPEAQKEYARRSYENYKKKVYEMSEYDRAQHLNKRRESYKNWVKNLSEEEREEFREKCRLNKRQWLAKMPPEKNSEFYKKKNVRKKEYLKQHPEKCYKYLVKVREKNCSSKIDGLEDYLQKLKDKSDKTGHYNDDLSFLNEKHPLTKNLISIEEFKRRAFIMQKLRCVIKSLGLSTEILMNYKKGVYTMQQLKTFLDMYNNKNWKNK